MPRDITEIIRMGANAEGKTEKQALMEMRELYKAEAEKQGIDLDNPRKKDLNNPLYLGYHKVETALESLQYHDLPQAVRESLGLPKRENLGCYIPTGL